MNIIETLRDNSAWLIFIAIFLVNIILGTIRKAHLQNKGQSLDEDRKDFSASPVDSGWKDPAKSFSRSPNMFPQGNSLRKTAKNAMFRR